MKRLIVCSVAVFIMLTVYSCGNQDDPVDKGSKVDTTGQPSADSLNRPLPTSPPLDTAIKPSTDSPHTMH
jgi:hypothetical protein